jgi:hypothetical protein
MGDVTKHLEAVWKVPKIFIGDLFSILVHGAISKIDDSLEEMARTSYPGSGFAAYMLSGVGYTIRQDYLLALTGLGMDQETFGMPMIFGAGPMYMK